MYECDNANCIKNGSPACDRWDGYATHCFEAKPIEVTEAPESPTPFGLLERLVVWLKRRMKYWFKRRLAVDGSGFTCLDGSTLPDIYLFEWQKMPEFYRWF